MIREGIEFNPEKYVIDGKHGRGKCQTCIEMALLTFITVNAFPELVSMTASIAANGKD